MASSKLGLSLICGSMSDRQLLDLCTICQLHYVTSRGMLLACLSINFKKCYVYWHADRPVHGFTGLVDRCAASELHKCAMPYPLLSHVYSHPSLVSRSAALCGLACMEQAMALPADPIGSRHA